MSNKVNIKELSKKLASMNVDVSETIKSKMKVSLRNNILYNLGEELETIHYALVNPFRHLIETLISNQTFEYRLPLDEPIEIDWFNSNTKWKKLKGVRFTVKKNVIADGRIALHSVNIDIVNLQLGRFTLLHPAAASFEYNRNDSGEVTVFTYKKNKLKPLLVAIEFYNLFYNEFDTMMHKPPINIKLRCEKQKDIHFTTYKDFLFHVGEMIYKNVPLDSEECEEKGCTVMGGKKKQLKLKNKLTIRG